MENETHETHLVSINLANDYGAYVACLDMAREESDLSKLGEAIQSFVAGEAELTGAAGDLFSHALGMVDWESIAKEYLDTVKEEEGEAE
jgi:hypothetical protein